VTSQVVIQQRPLEQLISGRARLRLVEDGQFGSPEQGAGLAVAELAPHEAGLTEQAVASQHAGEGHPVAPVGSVHQADEGIGDIGLLGGLEAGVQDARQPAEGEHAGPVLHLDRPRAAKQRTGDRAGHDLERVHRDTPSAAKPSPAAIRPPRIKAAGGEMSATPATTSPKPASASRLYHRTVEARSFTITHPSARTAPALREPTLSSP